MILKISTRFNKSKFFSKEFWIIKIYHPISKAKINKIINLIKIKLNKINRKFNLLI